MEHLKRGDWICAAQAALLENGPTQLSIVKLSNALGVTRGSFYYHFSSLNDLIDELVKDWETSVVDYGFEQARLKTESAAAELEWLIDFVTHLTDKLDLVFRQWAIQNSHVHKHMERLDQKRLAIMSDIFARLTGDKQKGEVFAKIAFYGYIGCLNSLPRPSSKQQKEIAIQILRLLERELSNKKGP